MTKGLFHKAWLIGRLRRFWKFAIFLTQTWAHISFIVYQLHLSGIPRFK